MTMVKVAYRRGCTANLTPPGDPGTDCLITAFKAWCGARVDN